MNANELADEVMEHYRAMLPRGFNVNWMQEAATMLRQQQAEIDNLAIVKYLNGVTISKLYAEIEALKAGKIRAYDNGVEDGRKPNTHPVSQYKAITNTKIEPTIVSYTHPVKELTDEDRSMLIRTLKWSEDLLRIAGHDEAVSDVQDCIMLLRKAQEK